MKSLQNILRPYPIRQFKKGQTLLFQGEVPHEAYVIKSGAIKIYNITDEGEEKIITLSAKDEILASSWVFNKSPVALYYYDAFVDSELYILPREELVKLLEKNINTLKNTLDRFINLYVGATIHINALEHSKSSGKIIHLLHYLKMRFGKQQSNGSICIELRLTHQDIANMLGLTRETVATELAKLKKQGVVSYKGQHYTIQSDKLQRLHGEDDFKSLML